MISTLKSFFKNVVHSGTASTDLKSEKRNVILTNKISLLPTLGIVLLLILRSAFSGPHASANTWLVLGCVLFIIPIMLNRFGAIYASRIVLCWLPSIFVIYVSYRVLNTIEATSVSSYLGIRFYLIAFCCFPFLVFDVRRAKLFWIGLIGPVVCILFFDRILSAFGVGYGFQSGHTDPTYFFNNVRVFISVLIVCMASYLLKSLAERNEELNEKLIQKLDEKNKAIQQQADEEVHELNHKLYLKVRELSEREFLLNQSQRIARIGSWEYRIKDAQIFWSDELYNIVGLDKSFSPSTPHLADVFGADNAVVITEVTDTLLRTGKSYDLTISTKTPLGYIKWLRMCAFPIHDGDKIVGARGICHDITYYKEAEELMRASEARYRSLFEQASNPILITDFKGNFTDVNTSFCRLFGYSREELLTRHISDVIESRNLTDRPIRFDLLAQGDHIFSERQMVKKDGTIVEVEANVKRVDENTVMAIVRDVTDLRKAQKEQQLSEARFRGAFEDSATGMALVTMDGKWLKVNRALCVIVGYTEEELLQGTFREITHPDDLAADERNMEQSLRGELTLFQVQKRYLHKSGAVVWVNINVSVIKDSSGRPQYFVAQIEDITDRQRIEWEKEHARHLLNERIKELTTLYKVSRILYGERKPIQITLDEIASILPNAWQHQDVAAARITWNGAKFDTPNFSKGAHSQTAKFVSPDGVEGTIEVVYLEPRPADFEGPFMVEERHLINMVAEMIQIFLNQTYGEAALKQSQANLNATINNTQTLIWSVDTEYKLITFNQTFEKYVKQVYDMNPMAGSRLLPDSEVGPDMEEFRQKWIGLYNRAINGEIFTFEEHRRGQDMLYSLGPIKEADRVIGANVFADNITKRKAHDRELAEANRKIDDLKLMALRSVMSPHFIFNVLNSIQFFIARNDRLNAISYLSTFSKLIRRILTHSVNSSIKLEDEIEMLRNYVDLEMTRFENKFDFFINVDPEVEVDAIEIPSLLIQPYVENAILHGLYNKQGRGTLKINIHDRDDLVVFEIEDDGVGREAAIKLRQKNFPTHKSMGIRLTEERLKLIKRQSAAAFEIEDLVNAEGPCGTRVTISIGRQ